MTFSRALAQEMYSIVDNFYDENPLTKSLIEESFTFFEQSYLICLALASAPHVSKEGLEYLREQSDVLDFGDLYSKENYLKFIDSRMSSLEEDSSPFLVELKIIFSHHQISGGGSPLHPEELNFANSFEETLILSLWHRDLSNLTKTSFTNSILDSKTLSVCVNDVLLNSPSKIELSNEDEKYILSFKNLADGVFYFLLKKGYNLEVSQYRYTPRKYFVDIMKAAVEGDKFYTNHYGSLQEEKFYLDVCNRVGDKRLVQTLLEKVTGSQHRYHMVFLLNCPRLLYKDFKRYFSNKDFPYKDYIAVNCGMKWSVQDWQDLYHDENVHPLLKETLLNKWNTETYHKELKNFFLLKKILSNKNQQRLDNVRAESYNRFGKALLFWAESKREQPNLTMLRQCVIQDLKLPVSMKVLQMKWIKSMLSTMENSHGKLDKEIIDRNIKELSMAKTRLRKELMSLPKDSKNRLHGIF